jgi:hypothetical protein
MPIAIGAVTAGTAIASAIAGTKNAKLKREYEANLMALDQSQKAKLEDRLKAAKTREERQLVLAQTLGQATGARIAGIEQQKLESQKTFNKLLVIGGITLAIVIAGIIIIKVKKK